MIAAAWRPLPAADSGRTRGFAEWLLFLLFAGQAFRNLAGWPGFLLCAGVFAAGVAWSLWRRRSDRRLLLLPPELVAFLAFCASSLVWSQYQWATALGLIAQWGTAAAGVWLAVALSWQQLLAALSAALVRVLGLSLAFEVLVTLVLRDRLAPVGANLPDNAPGAFFWSENALLTGGPIQGIVGNRNLLAFVALLALLTVGAELLCGAASPTLRWAAGIAVTTLALTRSATVLAVLAGILLMIGVLMLVRKAPSHGRSLLQGGILAVLSLVLAAALSALPVALGVLGRSDLTNRVDIWRTVLRLAEERPVAGWGWISYWAPWTHPFDGLVVIDGVEYLQAHNALLDVVLQLGLVGGGLAVGLAGAAVVRGWTRGARHSSPSGWLPLLLLCALLGQSITESRLLVEGNWALFVALSAKLVLDGTSSSGQPEFTGREPAAVSIGS